MFREVAARWYAPMAEPAGECEDMAEWISREHSKGDVDRAGAFLVPWWLGTSQPSLGEVGNAFSIVENWRTCHSYPLNAFQVNLRSRARRVEPDALVAQRLKRFTSVMNKLAREPNMKLSQMQDLGGCRAIMSNVKAVDDLVALYRGAEDDLFPSAQAPKVYDYIRCPKSDGAAYPNYYADTREFLNALDQALRVSP
jgi:hypothetical protein